MSAEMGGGGLDQNKTTAKKSVPLHILHILPLRDQVSTFIKSYAHHQALNKYRL